MKINNSKKLGDTLRLNVGANTSITDLDITDNFFELQQILTSSFDPNDKTILEGALLPFIKVGDYVTYLIRFENKGTAPANFIILTDSIDTNKFDESSIIPISSSHKYSIVVKENVMEILFEQINLGFPPDKENHGYFYLKLKLNLI